jgi:hypothetical protein
MRSLWLVLAIVGCKGEARPELVEPRSSVPAQEPMAEKASSDIPAWAPIDKLDGAPAVPSAWKADGRPTLAVFSASWCPGCTASALADRRLVRDYGKDVQVGVALHSEADGAFAASPYARALSTVPVWSEASTAKLTEACHPTAIPRACLYDKDKMVWTGEPSEAAAVLEARRAGKLAAWLADAARSEETVRAQAKEALTDPSKIAEVVAATHGRAGRQNSIAWDLVDRDNPSRGAVALAVALARDAVASDGGLDFALLDTYALALAKAGRVRDAAQVGKRVIAVCEAVQGKCAEERKRAEDFIARAARGA